MVMREVILVTLNIYSVLFSIAGGKPVLKITAIEDMYTFYHYIRNYAGIVSCNN